MPETNLVRLQQAVEQSAEDYQAPVGCMWLGGCGSNNLRLILDAFEPKDYPDFYHFGGNTDARVHIKHFGNKEEPRQKMWQDVGALTIHLIGKEVTHGRGSGADPEVGRRAAESPESMEAMRVFLETVEEVVIVTSVGGGTGTAAAPVAAKLAKDMGKTVLAIVVMPDPKYSKTKRAIAALNEIRGLVPTIAIHNEYLTEYRKTLPNPKEHFGYKQGWAAVNEHSVFPTIKIVREIIQVTGNVINLDEADWKTLLKYGNYVYLAISKIEPTKMEETSAEAIVADLFKAEFQDPSIIGRGKAIAIWWHGDWSMDKGDEVLSLVKARVMAKQPNAEIEVHPGMVTDVTDEEMWVAIVIVAGPPEGESRTVPEGMPVIDTVAVATPSEPAVVDVPKVATSEMMGPRLVVSPPTPRPRLQSDTIQLDVEVHSEARGDLLVRGRFFRNIPQDLIDRYQTAMIKEESQEKLEDIFEEVRKATGGKANPVLPDRLLPKPAKESFGASLKHAYQSMKKQG